MLPSKPPAKRFAARLLSSAALVAVVALTAAGCTTTGSSDVTGSIQSQPATYAEWRRVGDQWGERYRANPKDPQAAIHYAQALRATEQRDQAVAVLERASIENPHDKELLGAYGRALADVGRYEQALNVLSLAHTPDQPDWRILNVQGAVLDQLRRHAEARHDYNEALRIKPNDPAVLSNLGLSYALTNDLKKAEETLRLASSQPGAAPKIRQNLALVVAMQGRVPEAENIARFGLPPAEADASVTYLRNTLTQYKSKQGSRAPAPARRKLSSNQ